MWRPRARFPPVLTGGDVRIAKVPLLCADLGGSGASRLEWGIAVKFTKLPPGQGPLPTELRGFSWVLRLERFLWLFWPPWLYARSYCAPCGAEA